jgi:Archaeal fructose-1,6-bisphosphatase and related enzymes of inositol monophosphatase family
MMLAHDLQRLASGVEIAVRDTARFIRREKKAFVRGDAEFKGPNDLVSYVDRTAEKQLVESFSALIPGCGFINEEGGDTNPDAEWVWVIDPLDGTTNFVYDLPVFCISVGLLHNGQRVMGVVNEINRDEYFLAIKGQGAKLNNKPIRVSTSTQLRECLLATGFPSGKATRWMPQT